jgi:hypothetical protein
VTAHDVVIRGAGVLAVAGVLIGGGTYVVGDGGGGSALEANLWIDTNGGTCTRSASIVEYVDAAACSSLSTAYAAATYGDVVGMREGSYGNQTLLEAVAKTNTASEDCEPLAAGSTLGADQYPVAVTDFSECIYFRPETDADVTFGTVDIEVPFFYLDGLGQVTTGRIAMGTEATNCDSANEMVVSGIASRSGLTIRGMQMALYNSDFNLGDSFLQSSDTQVNGDCPPTKVHVKGNTWRNLLQYQRPNQTGSSGPNEVHIACIHQVSGVDVVYEKNKFLNCAQSGLSIQNDGIVRPKVVQNVFDEICSHQDLGVLISSGTFTSGSNVITSVSSTAGLSNGWGVFSIRTPHTTNYLDAPTVPTISSTTANTITMSMNASSSGTTAFSAGSLAQDIASDGVASGTTCDGNYGLAFTAAIVDPFSAFNIFYNQRDYFIDTSPPSGDSIGEPTSGISYGNVRTGLGVTGDRFYCNEGVAHSYIMNANDWPASTGSPYNCGSAPDGGTGGVIGAADLEDAGGYDFRIGATSDADDLVPTGVTYGVPVTDIAGNTRVTAGGFLDAGPYDETASAP